MSGLATAPLNTAPKDGDRYFDRPVVVNPKIYKDTLALAVNAALNGGKPKLPPRLLVRYDRVPLKWMKRDDTGNLVPR